MMGGGEVVSRAFESSTMNAMQSLIFQSKEQWKCPRVTCLTGYYYRGGAVVK